MARIALPQRRARDHGPRRRYANRLGVSGGANEVSNQTAIASAWMRRAGFRLFRCQLTWDTVWAVKANGPQWTNWDAMIQGLAKQFDHLHVILQSNATWATTAGTDNGDPPGNPSASGSDGWADWASWCDTVATRYKGLVSSYEVWNEADLPNNWKGTTAEYARYLSAGYDAIKAADPDVTVTFSGLAFGGTGYRATMYADALADATYPCAAKHDAANFHHYSTLASFRTTVNTIRAAQAASSVQRPIWVTETGYSSTPAQQELPNYTNGTDAQARWARDMLPIFLDVFGMDKVFWFTWRDDATKGASYATHGLITEDAATNVKHQPKPVWFELRRLLAR